MATRKILTSHRGRKCRYPKCRRELSIYNHNTHCHVHLNKMTVELQLKTSEK